jgi:hypothetical protein
LSSRTCRHRDTGAEGGCWAAVIVRFPCSCRLTLWEFISALPLVAQARQWEVLQDDITCVRRFESVYFPMA